MKRRYFVGLALSGVSGYYAGQFFGDIPKQALADVKTLLEKNTPKIRFDPEFYSPSKERKP